MDGRSGDIHRSRALDGIRGLAALSVLVFHVWLYRTNRPMGDRSLLFDQVGFALHLGLICFFVLSGFLLFRGFARAALTGDGPASLRTYAVRRAARIVPAYYACLLGCIALYAVVGLGALVPDPERLWLFAAFAQNYAADTHMQIDPVTWTLVVEMAFYLVLPLIALAAFALGPRRPGAQTALLLALVAATIGWNHLVHVAHLGEIAHKGLPSFLGQFALGMLAAQWLELRRLRGAAPLDPARTALAAAAGLALVVATAAFHETDIGLSSDWRIALADLPAGAGFALIIAAVAAGSGATVRGLATPRLAAVGVVSYGIYLWHLPLLLATRKAGLLPEPFVPRLAVVLALSILAGALSWRWIEQPAIAWSHRRAGRRNAPAAPRRPRPETARA